VVLADEYGADAADNPGARPRSHGGNAREGGHERAVLVPLTQEHLATLAGTTRPTVNRVLREMQDDGAVRLGRGRIEITDLRALRAVPSRDGRNQPRRRRDEKRDKPVNQLVLRRPHRYASDIAL
jgi:hypothetical protein